MQRGSARGVRPGKKCGSPVASGRVSDAAERSPAVYLANLKADMLLDKHLQVLRRAQAAFVHRIVIDQKILFRRFQAKLRRSKLACARLCGNKDMAQQQWPRDLHVMNTNCGQDTDDLEFLKKLQYRPCIVDHSGDEAGGGRDYERKTPPVTEKDIEDLIRAVMDEQEPPSTEKTLHSLNTIGLLLEEAKLDQGYNEATKQAEINSTNGGIRQKQKVSIRPVTTPAVRADTAEGASTRSEQRSVRTEKTVVREDSCSLQRKGNSQTRSITPQPKEDPHPGGPGKSYGPRPYTSPTGSQQSQRQSEVNPPKPSPKIARRVISPVNRRKSAMSSLTVGICSSDQTSRRPSQAAGVTSMFEKQKKVDLVALRLEEARNVDYTLRVSAFIKTLLELDKSGKRRSLRNEAAGGEPGEGQTGGSDLHTDKQEEVKGNEWKEELKGDRKFDYYATKMALSTASVKRASPFRLPGTPEEINRKLVGDQTIKSITMPTITMPVMTTRPEHVRHHRLEAHRKWEVNDHHTCRLHHTQPDNASTTNILIIRHEA